VTGRPDRGGAAFSALGPGPFRAATRRIPHLAYRPLSPSGVLFSRCATVRGPCSVAIFPPPSGVGLRDRPDGHGVFPWLGVMMSVGGFPLFHFPVWGR